MAVERKVVDIWGDEPPVLPSNPPNGWGREEIVDPVNNFEAVPFRVENYLTIPQTKELETS